MGQRHQIYYQKPEIYYNEGNINNKKPSIGGIHHQWLYGTLPLRALKRVIKFVKAGGHDYDWYCNKSDAIMQHLYSIDHTEGYYHRVCDITEEMTHKDGRINFKEWDNNDGITILKLPKYPNTTVKYCFLFFHGGDAECRKTMVPLSASEYLGLYYSVDDTEKRRLDALTAGNSLVKFIDKNAELLTLEEVKEMFPLSFMSEEELKEEEK